MQRDPNDTRDTRKQEPETLPEDQATPEEPTPTPPKDR